MSNEKSGSSPLSDDELSQYWYCPNDRNMLQIHHSRLTPNPYFNIIRDNIEIAVNNAIASRKIPPEAADQTRDLIELIFEREPTKQSVDLVGVICPQCKSGFAAPKVSKIVGVAEDQARKLFETQRALETKTYGPFRFVDHFGLSRPSQEERTRSRGFFGRIWFYIFILGFRTFLMIFFLYYILGFEVRVGKRWLPLGPVLLILAIVVLIIIVLNTGILSPIVDLVSDFY